METHAAAADGGGGDVAMGLRAADCGAALSIDSRGPSLQDSREDSSAGPAVALRGGRRGGGVPGDGVPPRRSLCSQLSYLQKPTDSDGKQSSSQAAPGGTPSPGTPPPRLPACYQRLVSPCFKTHTRERSS